MAAGKTDVEMLLKVVLLVITATVCLAGTPRLVGKARPCKFKDLKCIGNNLAINSICKLKTRPMFETYVVAKHRFETPHFNASYIDNNLKITGMKKCFVSEFYINMNKDTGVLGIDCPNLNFESDRTLIQHRLLEEDSIYHYKINGTYPMIRLTTTLDRADVLDMCKESTFAYITQLPKFNINPKDKPTKKFLSKDLTLLNIFERETFFYRAKMLALMFINARLCDFGCNF